MTVIKEFAFALHGGAGPKAWYRLYSSRGTYGGPRAGRGSQPA